MKRSAVLLLTGILRPVPVSALAADYSAKPMSRVSAFNWSGFYAGAHGGWAWGESGAVDLDGWFFGGQLGFNYQAPGNSFVWGGEVDAAFGDISGTVVAGVTSKADGIGTLRARGGIAADRTLIYATGGLAWARNEITIVGVSDNQTHTGWTVGGGVEQDFGNGWSAKLEYLYIDLGDKTYFSAILPLTADAQVHTVKFGLNYRFGH